MVTSYYVIIMSLIKLSFNTLQYNCGVGREANNKLSSILNVDLHTAGKVMSSPARLYDCHVTHRETITLIAG